jgi:site-specific DNA recombinase
MPNSNLREFHESAIMVSANTATAWSSSGYKQRELIQKIIFPEGVYYDLENQSFRTTRVNLVIAPIPQLYSISRGIKDKQEAYYGLLSSQVG